MTTYSEVTITGFNASPPPDDGTQVAANEVTWQKHLDKIGIPLRDAIETTQTNVSAAITSLAGSLKGARQGLQLSNNSSDQSNDIDIGAGFARDAGNADTMTLGATLTKRLDASWTVGDTNGGLDTGTVQNGWYHVFLIKRSDTGVVDGLFSTELVPTLPGSYDYYRRIGSVLRESGANVQFWQRGNTFLYQANRFISDETAITWQLKAIDIPPDVNVMPIVSVQLFGATGVSTASIGDYADTGQTCPFNLADMTSDDGNASGTFWGAWSDTSQQIHVEISGVSTTTNLDMFCNGWVDPLGEWF